MSTTYRVAPGDTFDSISRKKYGTQAEAGRIARANPGVSEPLASGTEVIVPPLPDAPADRGNAIPAATLDEVALLIDGQRFRFWDRMSITRAIDSMDTVTFGAPFDHQAPGFRETFRPFSFKPVAILVGGDPLFTGTMVDVLPSLANGSKTIAVSAYSRPGVLNDCTPPASAFPLEFDAADLRTITDALIGPFGLAPEFRANAGGAFERVACSPGKEVLAFLAELAKQRGLVISSTERGNLLFWDEVETGSPVARLQQGETPVLSVEPVFAPQQYYSHVTGVEPVVVGLSGAQYTVRNPRLSGITRPHSFEARDTLEADIKGATEAKAGRMFGNVAAYTARVTTWRDPQGELWKPNTTLKLTAPDAMIYNEYEFVIRSVSFEQGPAARTATIELAIPGSFRGTIPEALPWDG